MSGDRSADRPHLRPPSSFGVGKAAQAGILDLIGRVYDAALDETLWPGLASQIAQTFNYPSTVVQLRSMQNGGVEPLTATANLGPDGLQAYVSHYGECDVWLQRAAATHATGVLASKDLITDQELERTEFYQDLLRTLEIFHVVGAAFPVENDALCVRSGFTGPGIVERMTIRTRGGLRSSCRISGVPCIFGSEWSPQELRAPRRPICWNVAAPRRWC